MCDAHLEKLELLVAPTTNAVGGKKAQCDQFNMFLRQVTGYRSIAYPHLSFGLPVAYHFFRTDLNGMYRPNPEF